MDIANTTIPQPSSTILTILANGDREWKRNGVLHRDNGRPAVIRKIGESREWWIDGIKQPDPIRPVTKGAGAGGTNTTRNGSQFEIQTDASRFLVKEFAFSRHYFRLKMPPVPLNKIPARYFFLQKKYPNKTIYAFQQHAFREFVHRILKVKSHLIPDEAYLIHSTNTNKWVLKILEKKSQHVNGSVEDKLLCAPWYKEEYRRMFEEHGIEVRVEYAYCLNGFLADKINTPTQKYVIRKQIWKQHNIVCFCGLDEDYSVSLHEWIEKD